MEQREGEKYVIQMGEVLRKVGKFLDEETGDLSGNSKHSILDIPYTVGEFLIAVMSKREPGEHRHFQIWRDFYSLMLWILKVDRENFLYSGDIYQDSSIRWNFSEPYSARYISAVLSVHPALRIPIGFSLIIGNIYDPSYSRISGFYTGWYIDKRGICLIQTNVFSNLVRANKTWSSTPFSPNVYVSPYFINGLEGFRYAIEPVDAVLTVHKLRQILVDGNLGEERIKMF